MRPCWPIALSASCLFTAVVLTILAVGIELGGCKGVDAPGSEFVGLKSEKRSERKSEATGGLLGVNLDLGDTGWLGIPVAWWIMRRRGRMANAAVDRLIQRLEHGKECAMTAQNVVTMIQQHRDETQKWLHRRVKAVTK